MAKKSLISSETIEERIDAIFNSFSNDPKEKGDDYVPPPMSSEEKDFFLSQLNVSAPIEWKAKYIDLLDACDWHGQVSAVVVNTADRDKYYQNNEVVGVFDPVDKKSLVSGDHIEERIDAIFNSFSNDPTRSNQIAGLTLTTPIFCIKRSTKI